VNSFVSRNKIKCLIKNLTFSGSLASYAIFAVMATTETTMTNTCIESTTTDGKSPTVGLDYFGIVAIVAGAVGTVANGLVLYVLCTLEEVTKNMTNVLFINQMAADLYSCVMLVIVFSTKVPNIFLQGPGGYWLCYLLISEDMLWFGLNESIMNLASITIERYIMIVHPTWHKNFFRPRMIYAAIIFTWAISVAVNIASFFPTTVIVDGECFPLSVFPNQAASVGFGIWNSVSFFLIELVIFVYCYGRILHVLHRRRRVLARQSMNPTTVTDVKAMKDVRLQMNIIKTMLIVTIVFVVSWLPNNVYFLMFFSSSDVNVVDTAYDTTILIAFVNVCINPFIYAGKYDLIRGRCISILTCKRKYCKTFQDKVSSVSSVAM
jgi:7 transmembrane receptor (rhodopsin family)